MGAIGRIVGSLLESTEFVEGEAVDEVHQLRVGSKTVTITGSGDQWKTTVDGPRGTQTITSESRSGAAWLAWYLLGRVIKRR